MTTLEAIILGLVQGLTEFLPISSSGHLVLVEALFHIHKGNIIFEVFLHFGTFMAVVIAFRNDIRQMILACYRWVIHPASTKIQWQNDLHLRLAVFIIIGTVPAIILGLTFETYLESVFSEPFTVSLMLLLTGIILYFTRWSKIKHQRIKFIDSIFIGLAQAVAMLPGISRSGSTISMGMYLGLSKEEAARFSFLLALPAILGATVLKATALIQNPLPEGQLFNLIAATVVAFISGYFAILFLLELVRRGKFSWFAFYCLTVAIAGMVYFH